MKECPVCNACFGDHMQICDKDQSLLLDLLPGLPVIEDLYRLDKKIGTGSLGMVFQATMIKTGQTVIVKIISPTLTTIDPSLTERFLEILSAFAGLEHVNIIKVYDFGQTSQNVLYFVTEYLVGMTLADILKHEAKLPIDMALNIMSKVCEGVTNANRNGVYHLDLKPSDILVYKDKKGQQNAKVLDFGLFKLKTTSLIAKLPPTQREIILGKPYYSAPELFTSEGDGRSEVYEIGAILYHLLTGAPPFTGGSYPMLKMQHMGVTPNSLREIRPEVPTTLESIIIKALEKRSSQRHSSVVSLAVQLSAQLTKYQEFLYNQSAKASTSKLPKVETLSPRMPEANKSDSSSTRKKPARLGTLIGVNNSIPALPNPPEPFFSKSPTSAPTVKSTLPEATLPKKDDTLPGLPEVPEFYSDNPTPAPMSAPPPISAPSPRKKPNRLPSLMGLNSLPTLPSPREISSNASTLDQKAFETTPNVHELTGGDMLKPSEEFSYTSSTFEKRVFETTPNINELTETLPTFSKPPESFYPSNTNPVSLPETNYFETDDLGNVDTEYSDLMSESGSFYSASMLAITTKVTPPPVVDPSTWFTGESDFLDEEFVNQNIITRPLVSESFTLDSDENIETQEKRPIFQQPEINETIGKFKISDFIDLPPSKEEKQQETPQQLSPTCVIYLFTELFSPAISSGQLGRQMHNGFVTEREQLAALLLTVSLFSLFSRGILEITVGSNIQKKQIAISQRNEGFVIRAINLDTPPLDILEAKIVDLLKQSNITRFYNIFLHIAQTSVATSEREAICEIVADAIADELVVRKLLQSKSRNRKLESGESAIHYELNCDLTPYLNQATSIQNWLQGLQQQPSVELSGRQVQTFPYILKYYTDLFRHNSKELSKT